MGKSIFSKKRFAFLLGLIISYIVIIGILFGMRLRYVLNEESIENSRKIKIEKQLLYDKDNIKVTVLGVTENPFMDTKIDVEIENKTDKDYYVIPHMIAIDGIMTFAQYEDYKSVNSGETRIVGISIGDYGYTDVLDKKNLGEIIFDIRLTTDLKLKGKKEGDIFINDINIKTNKFENAKRPNPNLEGDIILDSNGLIVRLIKQEGKTVKDNTIYLSFENNSDKNLFFYTEKFIFGEEKINNTIFQPVRAKTKLMKAPYLISFKSKSDGSISEQDEKLKSLMAVLDYDTSEIISDVVEYEWN